MTNQQRDEQRSNERTEQQDGAARNEKTRGGPNAPRHEMGTVVDALISGALRNLRPSRALWIAALEALGRSCERLDAGEFKIGKGVFTGTVVETGVKAGGGDEDTKQAEVGMLVEQWKRGERVKEDPGLPVRVRASTQAPSETRQALESCQKGDHISVAGVFFLHTSDQENEQRRQDMVVMAEVVL